MVGRADQRREGHGLMRWFVVIVGILVIAVVFDLGLIACAMLALLGLMLISRFLARSWITNLEATRECNRTEAEVGQTIAFNGHDRATTAGCRSPGCWSRTCCRAGRSSRGPRASR